MASIYPPLNSGNYEIRMLTILPAGDTPTSMVSCKLETTTLFDTIKYDALSYCWGDPNLTTDIILENTVIPITVNLGNALYHLRSLKVTRIWVDALCINQKDNQEKSYQIRNMRHIYEKADVTFSWLGLGWTSNPGVKSMPVMALIRGLFLDAPANFYHNCQSCRIDSEFGCLRDFFNLDYWHRCWIIQEVSASSRIQILYGDKSMDWDEMVTAIQKCRNSYYWSDGLKVAFTCLDQIMQFRLAYQTERRPPLCEAIVKSRKFQSIDPRDRIFALLGVSADGPEIVQMPNYLQPLHLISRDITRSLIRKHGRLELILLGKNTVEDARPPTGEKLPTWSPDWFSLDLPAESHLVADLRYVTKHSVVSDIVTRHGDTLEVEGVCIGRVVDCTTALVLENSPQSSPLPMHHANFSNHQVISYYQGASRLVLALLDCLTIVPWRYEDDLQKDYRHFTVSMTSKMFTAYSEKRSFIISPLRHFMHIFHNRIIPWFMFHVFHLAWCQIEGDRKYFDIARMNPTLGLSRWLTANESFIIDGRSINTWLAEGIYSIWSIIIYCVIQVTLIVIEVGVFAVGYYGITTLSVPPALAKILVLAVLVLTIWVGQGLRAIISYLEEYPEYECLQEYMEASTQYLQDSNNPPKKILLFDRGCIGMSFADTKIGDVAYFLLGCHKAVLLREVWIGNQIRYKVVGEVSVWLSDQDRDLYKSFLNIIGDEMGIPFSRLLQQKGFDERMALLDKDDYYDVVEQYRQNGSLQRLELI